MNFAWLSWVPFNALMSPYFQRALDAITGIRYRHRGPSYNDSYKKNVNYMLIAIKVLELVLDAQ